MDRLFYRKNHHKRVAQNREISLSGLREGLILTFDQESEEKINDKEQGYKIHAPLEVATGS